MANGFKDFYKTYDEIKEAKIEQRRLNLLELVDIKKQINKLLSEAGWSGRSGRSGINNWGGSDWRSRERNHGVEEPDYPRQNYRKKSVRQATEKQLNFIISLYKQLGHTMSFDDLLADGPMLSVDASIKIDELKKAIELKKKSGIEEDEGDLDLGRERNPFGINPNNSKDGYRGIQIPDQPMGSDSASSEQMKLINTLLDELGEEMPYWMGGDKGYINGREAHELIIDLKAKYDSGISESKKKNKDKKKRGLNSDPLEQRKDSLRKDLRKPMPPATRSHKNPAKPDPKTRRRTDKQKGYED